jgi:iron complex outermembrane receptor protein
MKLNTKCDRSSAALALAGTGLRITRPPASKFVNGQTMNPAPVAILLVLLLFASFGAVAHAQQGDSPPGGPPDDRNAGKEETINLDKLTVSTSTRTARAIDHIPGAVVAIPNTDLATIQLSSLDPNQILAQSIPGYTASLDDMNTSGELLRGKRPQFFLDGVLMSSPLRDVGRMAAAMVDPMMIDRIEVINGASAIEGLGGSGGMINYITKVPTQEGVVSTLESALETQLRSFYIGWKVTGLTMVKRRNFDLVVSLGQQNRPMYYDARGDLEYINTNGSYEDSTARSITAKLGYNFGANEMQRIQLYFNNYDLVGNNNYNSLAPGNRAAGIVQTAVRGAGPGLATSNHMRSKIASYTNSTFAGGTLKAIAYDSREDMAFGASIDPSKQDPAIAPLGTLVDASSVTSMKDGLKVYWVKPDFLTEGFEFNVGYDYNEDQTYQNLYLTNRTWLPTMHFKANSGYTQMSYDRGPVTLSAGARYQSGSISVPTFRTLYETAPATSGVIFTGGSKSYTTTVYNLGAVYRLKAGWSAFVGFTQGYDLPDIGTVIRNTNKPNQSMNTVAEINPVLTDSYEAGVNWHGKKGSFGADIYYARSPASTLVVTDPTTLLQTVSRNPQDREGIEFTGAWKFSPEWKITGTFSHMLAYTSTAPGLPVNISITPGSTVGQDPDKAVLRLDWTPAKRVNVDLVGTHFWGMNLNADKAASLHWITTPYTLINSSVTYRSDSFGSISLGCSNITNTFQIVNENGTSNTTYYAIQGRKFTISDTITF